MSTRKFTRRNIDRGLQLGALTGVDSNTTYEHERRRENNNNNNDDDEKWYLRIQAFYSAQHQVARTGCCHRLVQEMAEPEHAIHCEDFIVSQEKMCRSDGLPLLSDGVELEGHSQLLCKPGQAPSRVLNSG